jgi:hypothetical protein
MSVNQMMRLALVTLTCVAGSAWSQISGGQAQGGTTKIQGNTEINVSTSDVAAVATGQNNVARNRIGVIKGEQKGNTRITVNASKVTTVVGGRNKKACTNIGGIVSDECN